MTFNQARMLFAYLATVEANEIQSRWPPPPDYVLNRAALLTAEGNKAYEDAIRDGAEPEDLAWTRRWLRSQSESGME